MANISLRRQANFKSEEREAWSLFKAAFNRNIALGPALAVMLFVVAAVGSGALIAQQELNSHSAFVSAKAPKTDRPTSQGVLGVASYGYQSSVCKNNVCLRYELVGFAEDNWAANIFYNSQRGPYYSLRGSIRVNGSKFVYNIRGDGVTPTGYNLEPGETYVFKFYKGARGNGRVLNSLVITMPEAPDGPPVCDQPVPPGCYYQSPPEGEHSSNFDGPDGCGVLVCPLPPPPPPSYGYQIVPVPAPAPGSWTEGWIDNVEYGSSVPPGSVKISGWAFDKGSPANITMSLRNSGTGQEYKLSYTKNDYGSRGDVIDYLRSKIGSVVDTSTVAAMTSFFVKFDDLPAGNYYIYNASYNGNLFNIHSKAYQPIIISSSPPPRERLSITGPSSNYSQATVGQQYAAPFLAYPKYDSSGNQIAYIWKVGGNFPPGLKYSVSYCPPPASCAQVMEYNTLTVYGMPTQAGNYTFTVSAVDPAGPSAAVDFTLNVVSAPSYGYAGSLNIAYDETVSVPVAVEPGSGNNTLFGFKLTNTGKAAFGISSLGFDALSDQVGQSITAHIVDEWGNVIASTAGTNRYFEFKFYSTQVLAGQATRYWKFRVDVGKNASGSLSFTNNSVRWANGYLTPTYTNIGGWYSPVVVIKPVIVGYPRVGQLVKLNQGTLYLVGKTALHGFPDVATFESWNYSFSQIVEANAAEKALPIGVNVPTRNPACQSALDQIGGLCGLSDFRVLSPNGGEAWQVGSNVVISWTALKSPQYPSPTNNLFIDLVDADGYSNAREIGRAYVNVTSYTWTIPNCTASSPCSSNFQILPGKYKIRVSGGSGVSDTSDGAFLIFGESPSLSAKLSYSSPGGNVTAGAQNAEIFRFAVAAKGADAELRQFNFQISGNVPVQFFSNLNLFDNSNGRLLDSFSSNLSDSSVGFGFSSVVVPANTEREFSLRADLSAQSSSGTFSASLTDIFLQGLDKPSNVSGLPVSGNKLSLIGLPTVNEADLFLQSIYMQSSSDLLVWTASVCVKGNKSINDIKRENSKITSFPFNYVVYDISGQKYDMVMNAGGQPEEIKNGQCSEFGFAVQPQHRDTYLSTGKITVILDPYNYINETDEGNNSLSYQPTVPIVQNKTFRYLQIDTTSSNSWVAWREIEAYDQTGKKIAPAGASASASYSQSTPEKAYDGNEGTVWNAGAYSGKIVVDLGSNVEISKIRFLPAGMPNPASAAHYVYGRKDSDTGFTFITSFTGAIWDNTWLVHTYGKS